MKVDIQSVEGRSPVQHQEEHEDDGQREHSRSVRNSSMKGITIGKQNCTDGFVPIISSCG